MNKLQVIFVVALSFLGLSIVRAEEAKPNFVFIIADDLGWADVAFHGGNAKTPTLDGLAREGLELTQHYVAPVCSPTRAGFLTGRYWSRFNVTTPQNERALPFDTITLPRALKSLGYDTCITGKWHLGSKPEWGPNHFGFDHSYGSLAGGISPWNHRYKQGPFSQTWHRNEKLIEESGHVTDLIADEAVKWIESRGKSPFFLYVPFTAVHLPIKEPEEWVHRVPDSIQGEVPRHYAACVMHLDHAVSRIIEALEKKGVRENTLLVFTSDNGGSTVENNDLKYPDDNCPNGNLPGNNMPWRGRKGDLYEGGTRVPTIVSWPNRVKSRKVSSPVQIVDWMPTFCSLAGYRESEKLRWDGMDISSLLFEGQSAEVPERPIYTVAPSWRGRSLRLGKWKLIVHGGLSNDGKAASNKAPQRTELFDLSDDPGESKNLAGTEPEIAKRLLAEMQKISQADRDSMVGRGGGG